jgi:hypothetical protein
LGQRLFFRVKPRTPSLEREYRLRLIRYSETINLHYLRR